MTPITPTTRIDSLFDQITARFDGCTVNWLLINNQRHKPLVEVTRAQLGIDDLLILETDVQIIPLELLPRHIDAELVLYNQINAGLALIPPRRNQTVWITLESGDIITELRFIKNNRVPYTVRGLDLFRHTILQREPRHG